MSVEIIKNYLLDISEMKVIGSFTDPVQAAAAFHEYEKVDFLFLDIGMEVSGLDVARMLKNKVRFIVFVTGHVDFALEAFEFGDAYLVKPVNYDVLTRAIKHLLSRHKRQVEI